MHLALSEYYLGAQATLANLVFPVYSHALRYNTTAYHFSTFKISHVSQPTASSRSDSIATPFDPFLTFEKNKDSCTAFVALLSNEANKSYVDPCSWHPIRSQHAFQ